MNEKDKRRIPMLNAKPDECCGCSACMAMCPVNAIAMSTDECGFNVPIIDTEKCIRCQKCVTSCAFKKAIDEKKSMVRQPDAEVSVYAVRAKDAEVVSNSSSGGFFTVISDWIFEQQGAVASAIYDYEKNQMEFQLYFDKETRDKARGSKYIHAIMGNIYHNCIKWMKENPDKMLLFIGVGCQVAGFRKVLEHYRLSERAVLVDLICHGTPSQQLWIDYIHELEKKYGAKVEYVTFKDKRNGWNKPTAFAVIGNKEVPLDEYSYWFYEQFSLRESCHQCPYTCIERTSDITIGDYWGIEQVMPDFYHPMGTSLVLIQNERGMQVFHAIQEKLIYRESCAHDCIQPRLVSPAEKNKQRDKFWDDYKIYGVKYLMKKYHDDSKFVLLLKKCILKFKRGVRKFMH